MGWLWMTDVSQEPTGEDQGYDPPCSTYWGCPCPGGSRTKTCFLSNSSFQLLFNNISYIFFSNKNHWNMELIEKEWCKHATVNRIFIWNLRNHIASWILLTWVEVLEEFPCVYIYIFRFVKVTTLRLLASSDRQKMSEPFSPLRRAPWWPVSCRTRAASRDAKDIHSWIMSYHVQRLKATTSNDYKHIILVVYKSWKSFWPLAWRFEYRESVWEDGMISSSQ